jgi:hypothetical protein
LADNLRHYGVYILHGEDDDNVPARQAQTMAKTLDGTHRDWLLHLEPGKRHWWSNAWDDGGATCMDWPPMYDFFARHAIPPTTAVRDVRFVTANPGVSSCCHWLAIEGQQRHHRLSRANVHTWPNRRRFEGTTENVTLLRLDVGHLMSPGPVSVVLDGQALEEIAYPKDAEALWLERFEDHWHVVAPPPKSQKGPHRYGAVKDELSHRFLFVYGTGGTEQEKRETLAKAQLDAETYWYRGNGGVEFLADTQFDAAQYPERTVVLFGNADTNSQWSHLLPQSPVQVHRGRIEVGSQKLEGSGLAALFVQPRRDTDNASVIAVAATGPTGMRLLAQQSLFVPFVRFPDCLILSADQIAEGRATVRLAGYFGPDWSMKKGEFVRSDGVDND